jgi:hypothetical protein
MRGRTHGGERIKEGFKNAGLAQPGSVANFDVGRFPV